MALIDDYQARTSLALRTSLSNPDSPAATIPHLIREGLAVADAQAAFETNVGVSYDSTDPRHVRLGVRGVVLHLKQSSDMPIGGLDPAMTAWEEDLEKLRLQTAAAAFAPITDSAYVPSEPVAERPPFDSSHFDRLRMRPPRSGRAREVF